MAVCEHHAVMTPAALRAFAHEYRLEFPVAIDQSDGADPIPLTIRTCHALRNRVLAGRLCRS